MNVRKACPSARETVGEGKQQTGWAARLFGEAALALDGGLFLGGSREGLGGELKERAK